MREVVEAIGISEERKLADFLRKIVKEFRQANPGAELKDVITHLAWVERLSRQEIVRDTRAFIERVFFPGKEQPTEEEKAQTRLESVMKSLSIKEPTLTEPEECKGIIAGIKNKRTEEPEEREAKSERRRSSFWRRRR